MNIYIKRFWNNGRNFIWGSLNCHSLGLSSELMICELCIILGNGREGYFNRCEKEILAYENRFNKLASKHGSRLGGMIKTTKTSYICCS